MGSISFFTHIPLLRLGGRGYRFGHGSLFPMAFDDFNVLTLGAFEDHRKAYEATAPVFHRVDVEMDFPFAQPGTSRGMIQMKIPSDHWEHLDRLGWGIVHRFHDEIADPAWVALLLAAPASALPAPRLSVTFVLAPDDEYFDLGSIQGNGYQVQGDTDMEYLFLPEAAGPPLSEDTLTLASNLVNFVYQARRHPEFGPALSYLAAQTSPTLSKFEQLTLSIIALEALLLPELRSGLQSVFTRRLSNLLSVDDDHRRQLKKLAKQLYGYRSAGVHGDLSFVEDRADIVEQAAAPQALSAAVLNLASMYLDRMEKEAPVGDAGAQDTGVQNSEAGERLDQERQAIDQTDAPHQSQMGQMPLEHPPGQRAPNRLLRKQTPLVAGFAMSSNVPIQSLKAPQGKSISWSPLVGLGISCEGLAMGTVTDPILVPFNIPEVISMEERDIARDFIGRLRMEDSILAGMMIQRDSAPVTVSGANLQPFQRTRDLGVICLRLAGFSGFIDPELLGWYVYVESIRHRFPTVYRQSILMELGKDQTEQVSLQDRARIVDFWQMLASYNAEARHTGIDRLLTMYRRTFDHRFLPIAAQAGLMFSTLEAMLGRFRGRSEPVQLEDLVIAAAGKNLTEAAAWFSAEARGFRNAVAHGFWNPHEDEVNQPLGYLTSLLGALLPQFINAWLSCGDHGRQKPGHVFTELATQMVHEGRVQMDGLAVDHGTAGADAADVGAVVN